MIALVCGGRDYRNRAHVFRVLTDVHEGPCGPIALLIHGDAPGADTLGEDWAKHAGVPFVPYPAHWATEGRYAAGPNRNARMLKEGKPDVVFAFPGGNGTADMVAKSRRAKVFVLEV